MWLHKLDRVPINGLCRAHHGCTFYLEQAINHAQAWLHDPSVTGCSTNAGHCTFYVPSALTERLVTNVSSFASEKLTKLIERTNVLLVYTGVAIGSSACSWQTNPEAAQRRAHMPEGVPSNRYQGYRQTLATSVQAVRSGRAFHLTDLLRAAFPHLTTSHIISPAWRFASEAASEYVLCKSPNIPISGFDEKMKVWAQIPALSALIIATIVEIMQWIATTNSLGVVFRYRPYKSSNSKYVGTKLHSTSPTDWCHSQLQIKQ